jgi:anaerobic selenocysteine-containing dehydrogenase
MATKKTACILCSRNCGLEVETDGGQLKKIRGDDAHPGSKGYLCNKAARLDYYQNHADRLRHPLKRQPDGSFVRVGWDEALEDIARRLIAIRAAHGGDAFALVGGGGQGNHLGGIYSRQLLRAMGSRYVYSSLAQEKTGDFWVNGRLYGAQNCHPTEDVEHADYVIFIGCNPYQSHGIFNARDVLRDIRKDPARTMVVIDPRRTETAGMADIHLQLKPGTDAFLLLAMLALIVRENLHDRAFIDAHCAGFDEVRAALLRVPVEDYAARADVPLADIQRVARGFAAAERGCVRVDLGTQHTLHTTLNAYLEKLLYLLTGNFGRPGSNNLHTHLLPLIGDTDETKLKPGKSLKRTAFHGMLPIGGMYPPNILPDEILRAGDRRIRAIVVDSSNPLLTYADTQAQEEAFRALDLLVVVDVAMTETARFAHYVLPAASQFEKVEATGFTLEFPQNYFHLRRPILQPVGETLPEAEIYTRLLERMGAIPRSFPVIAAVARAEPKASAHLALLTALRLLFSRERAWQPCAASILYRTLGPTLGESAAAAPLLPLAMAYAREHTVAVRRAGHWGNSLTLGANLFRDILGGQSGIVLSRHEHEETWGLLKTPDRRVHLHIPEMIAEIRALVSEAPAGEDFPFLLMAGERRSYNANQIFRDPAWRKVDKQGAMRIHPEDAKTLGLEDGDPAACRSARGQIAVVVELDDSLRRGVVTVPHGYGNRHAGSEPIGPQINRLTSLGHCDPFSRTPYHKHVPVSIGKRAA